MVPCYEPGGIGWRHRRSVRSFLRHPQRSSDPDDSILHAETEAVRQLLDRLDLSRTRLGIVTLRDRAQVRASIGSDREQLLAALDTLEREAPQGRTHMAEAIRVATQALEDARPPGRFERALAIILLSDGRPTVPAPDQRAADEAVRAAKRAYRRGVHVHTVALGSSRSESRALVEIAEVSRGAFTALAEPGEIIAKLPHLDLSGLADVSVLAAVLVNVDRCFFVAAVETRFDEINLRLDRRQVVLRASLKHERVAQLGQVGNLRDV